MFGAWNGAGAWSLPRIASACCGQTISACETPTGGFATSYLKSYYNYSKNVHIIAGIDNLFDRNYVEHLDLRFAGATPNSGPLLAAWAPGFTAYGGVEFNW